MSPVVTVTLSGPPGSGKSRLHAAIVNLLRCNGVKVLPVPGEECMVGHGALPGTIEAVMRVEQTR